MSGRGRSAVRRSGTFDAFEVALRGARFSGTLDAMALPRVAGAMARVGRAAEVTWQIAGTADAAGRPALEVDLDGSVPLVCQRCLKPFSWTVAQRTLLLLARDERELARLDAEDVHEVLLAAAPVETLILVEDELLLTLPFAPRCERPGCTGAVSAAAREVRRGGESSFAALARMKKGARSEGKD
jgi:uncharacterized protein